MAQDLHPAGVAGDAAAATADKGLASAGFAADGSSSCSATSTPSTCRGSARGRSIADQAARLSAAAAVRITTRLRPSDLAS